MGERAERVGCGKPLQCGSSSPLKRQVSHSHRMHLLLQVVLVSLYEFPTDLPFCLECVTLMWLLCIAEGPYASSGGPHHHSHAASARGPAILQELTAVEGETGGCGDLPSPGQWCQSVSVRHSLPPRPPTHGSSPHTFPSLILLLRGHSNSIDKLVLP